jgi:antitoxin ParD1/3/4
MNISLTPQLEKLVSSKVASGRYYSASEVVREALRLLQARDEAREVQLHELRAKIAEGLDSLARGDWVDGDDFFKRLQQREETLQPEPR